MLKFFYSLSCLFVFITTSAQVRLPHLVSDSMILQRDAKTKIWGWAPGGEKVTVHFHNKIYSTITKKDGKWIITLSPEKAGGPYNMEIDAGNQVIIKNILIGDVWVCSGQSNMELMMERVKYKYADEIAKANNAEIRQFTVPDKYDFRNKHDDVDNGNWISVSPKNILSFSAVAYFFAKEIYAKYKIPVGLINSALGGSPAEAWLSEEALKSFPDYYDEMQKLKDTALINAIENKDKTVADEWYNQLNEKDEGIKYHWKNEFCNDDDWKQMEVPGYWAGADNHILNGAVWFRKTIEVPASMVSKTSKLELGRIIDADSVFINGQYVGNTTYQYPPRRYILPPNVLKEGKNTIAIRVISNSGKGGFVLDKPYQLTTATDTIELKGNWKYKVGAVMPALPAATFVRWKPGGLYNAMIAPLLNYSIKGVIWYQGEANTNKATEYQKLFPALIKDWRQQWKQGDFPFLYVQLPNFMETKSQPSESEWAQLRESQLKTLSIPNTGMAITIDLGEWNDIHPSNKEDVGKRLALVAESVAYKEKNIVYSGPLYQSMKIENNRIILSFTNVGSGLTAKGNTELKYFSIAGTDKKFVRAKAIIQNNKVIVWNDAVKDPVVVRYAWADNPEGANLYNKEGLPASPFTTDSP
ncbi:MAG TPA: sialate O-acetylesterase [Chitinophagaceae bacterium]